jgi:tRNA pseudouridine38-40 synthase
LEPGNPTEAAGLQRRIRATVAYDGTDFHGWQVQPGLPTIQNAMETVLAELEGAPVPVHASGRTDAGVHALAQVVAFQLANRIPVENLHRAMNRRLPPSIRIIDLAECAADFHPRFQAKQKTYEYRVFRGAVCPPFLRRYVHYHPYPLDLAAIGRLAPLLEGEHDFSAFAAADEKDELGASKVRRIFRSSIDVAGDTWSYRVTGSGFLKHMVRNIAGTLIEGGKGNLDAGKLRAFLEPGCPVKAGPRAPASGLFLISVEYD